MARLLIGWRGFVLSLAAMMAVGPVWAEAPAHAAPAPAAPAHAPAAASSPVPESFAASQFIDASGCVLRKEGEAWVPRLTPDGVPDCGYPSTPLPTGMTAPTAAAAAAPETLLLDGMGRIESALTATVAGAAGDGGVEMSVPAPVPAPSAQHAALPPPAAPTSGHAGSGATPAVAHVASPAQAVATVKAEAAHGAAPAQAAATQPVPSQAPKPGDDLRGQVGAGLAVAHARVKALTEADMALCALLGLGAGTASAPLADDPTGGLCTSARRASPSPQIASVEREMAAQVIAAAPPAPAADAPPPLAATAAVDAHAPAGVAHAADTSAPHDAMARPPASPRTAHVAEAAIELTQPVADAAEAPKPAPKAETRTRTASPAPAASRKAAPKARATAAKPKPAATARASAPARPAATSGAAMIPAQARYLRVALTQGGAADATLTTLRALGLPAVATQPRTDGRREVLAGPFPSRKTIVSAYDQLTRAGYANLVPR